MQARKIAAQKPASDDYRRPAIVGYVVIFITFGAVGGWAAVAPLDSAAIAPGVISVETNRKTVQHLEGGIVQKIMVGEGDRVEAGQVLFELDSTESRANLEITQNQLSGHLAKEARLRAERQSQQEIDFPEELLRYQSEREVARIIEDQREEFAERRRSIAGQIELLESRKVQYQSEIEGLDKERVAKERQAEFLDDELSGLRALFEKGLTPKGRLLALERELSSLQGQIGRSIAERAKALNGIGETELRIKQIQHEFFEEATRELVDVRNKISDIREKHTVIDDRLRRVNVVAPVSGTVQNQRVFTVGAVLRPGDPLVDIVPEEEALIIRAHFAPQDADNIRPGMSTEVRFPSFSMRTMPLIEGTIQSVSNDRLVDDATKEPYFLALLRVDQQDLPEELRGRLKPGLPADVVVPTGERTVIQYLVEPLTNALRKTMREE